MAVHTFTNINPNRFFHNLGGRWGNYTLAYGESVDLEPWQLVSGDLVEINAGLITADPPLPNNLVGEDIRISTYNPDKGPVLDKLIWELRTTAPTAGEKAALAGSFGTPSDSNRYVTQDDPIFSSGYTPKVWDIIISVPGAAVFTLPFLPVDTTVAELFVEGIRQHQGVDYTLVGTTLTWISPDFILEPGDTVHVTYLI